MFSKLSLEYMRGGKRKTFLSPRLFIPAQKQRRYSNNGLHDIFAELKKKDTAVTGHTLA